MTLALRDDDPSLPHLERFKFSILSIHVTVHRSVTTDVLRRKAKWRVDCKPYPVHERNLAGTEEELDGGVHALRIDCADQWMRYFR